MVIAAPPPTVAEAPAPAFNDSAVSMTAATVITSSAFIDEPVASVPVNQQPFEATLATTATSTPLPTPLATPAEVVRAARVASAVGGMAPGDRATATVSFYYCRTGGGASGDGGGFCGRMRDGSVVYSGAAACDVAYLGQHFKIVGDPTGREYRCADTGSAVHGLHRDIWFNSSAEGWAWLRSVGSSATIEIVP